MKHPSSRLTVGHIITQLELGGAQQNTLYTIQNLDRERFTPFLMSGRGSILDNEAEQMGCPVFYINALGRLVNPWQDALAFFEIYLVLKREKPHIVHTHSSKAGILGRWAAWLANVPVIIHTFHGFGFNREQGWLTRNVFLTVEKLTAKITTAFIAVSKSNLEEALDHGIGRSEQYHLIRSGISLKVFQAVTRRPNTPAGLFLKPEYKLVTTIGPFKPQKNLLDFIEAAALVYGRCPLARFLLVGDGVLRPTLEAAVIQRGLKDVFFMPGWRRDIPNIFQRTDIFCMTSLWEGLPRALVEAMVAGLPSVCNNVDGVRDILRDGFNGFLVPSRHPEMTAERLVYLMNNPNFALQMGQEARRSISDEFDIDLMVTRQEKLYDEICLASAII